ncbi:MAG: WecB/TagA/CpsF family glycosyltransferase [Candidatus Margulisbacteria bacterium]|nr:WecB/TagA/CpsF family glycosyltransferase [Candidatus Margulisiibacteriota bacterium]
MTKRENKLLGLLFFNQGYTNLILQINEAITAKKSCSIITPTTEILGACLDDQAIYGIISEAQILLPDSVTLILLSRLLRKAITRRLTGIDTIYELGRQTTRQYKVYLLGAQQSVLDQTVKRAGELFPAFKIVGCQHGYFDAKTETDKVIKHINDSGAEILFIGMGFPRQERFISEYGKQILAPVKITVGGSYDVISGHLKRAPRWMQNSGLEWLFRLLQEPTRIFRMSLIPWYLLKLLSAEIQHKYDRH